MGQKYLGQNQFGKLKSGWVMAHLYLTENQDLWLIG